MLEQEIPQRLDESEVGRVWSEFIAVERTESAAFEALLLDPKIRPEFQERAIDVLLTPNFNLLPFPVNVKHDYNSFTVLGYGRNNYQFTPEQASYVAKRIPHHMKQAWQIYDKEHEDGRGQYDKNREAKNAISSLRNLNSTIPRLMTVLPPDEAEKLFESFSPFDIGMSPGSSVYLDPLNLLFDKEGIDDSYKIRAREKALREGNELLKKLTRRWKNPEFLCGTLLSVLSYRTSGDGESYPDELAAEVNFILSNTGNSQLLLGTQATYEDLTDLDTKHRLVRRQAFGKPVEPWSDDELEIRTDSDLAFVKQVLIDFPEDSELAERLQSKVKKYDDWKERARVDNEQYESQAQQGQKALSSMRLASK